MINISIFGKITKFVGLSKKGAPTRKTKEFLEKIEFELTDSLNGKESSHTITVWGKLASDFLRMTRIGQPVFLQGVHTRALENASLFDCNFSNTYQPPSFYVGICFLFQMIRTIPNSKASFSHITTSLLICPKCLYSLGCSTTVFSQPSHLWEKFNHSNLILLWFQPPYKRSSGHRKPFFSVIFHLRFLLSFSIF